MLVFFAQVLHQVRTYTSLWNITARHKFFLPCAGTLFEVYRACALCLASMCRVLCAMFFSYKRSPPGVVNCSQGVMQEKCISMEKAFAR